MTGRGGADTPGAESPFGAMEDAVESIGTTLDEQTTCEELAAFVCRHFCDAAAVDLLPADAPATTQHPHAPDLSRVATAGDAGLLAPWPAHGARPLSVQALDEGHPITASIDLSGRVPRQVMTVPLLAHGRLYGVMLAVRQGKEFTDQETTGTHYAARLAAVHLGHSRQHNAVRSTVLNLQRALLAEPGRPHPNLDLATRYLPAGGTTLVGGDWFETVRLHFGRTLLVVGDVMGHGLNAAVDMNAYRSMLRYVASTDLPPHRVLRRLDAAVAEDGNRPPVCWSRSTRHAARPRSPPPGTCLRSSSPRTAPSCSSCRSAPRWAPEWAATKRPPARSPPTTPW